MTPGRPCWPRRCPAPTFVRRSRARARTLSTPGGNWAIPPDITGSPFPLVCVQDSALCRDQRQVPASSGNRQRCRGGCKTMLLSRGSRTRLSARIVALHDGFWARDRAPRRAVARLAWRPSRPLPLPSPPRHHHLMTASPAAASVCPPSRGASQARPALVPRLETRYGGAVPATTGRRGRCPGARSRRRLMTARTKSGCGADVFALPLPRERDTTESASGPTNLASDYERTVSMRPSLDKTSSVIRRWRA